MPALDWRVSLWKTEVQGLRSSRLPAAEMKVELGSPCHSDQFSGECVVVWACSPWLAREDWSEQWGWGRTLSLGHTDASPPGAGNQTLQRLLHVLHADSGPCLPHLLSHLCRDLGPGVFRMAARMYLQKGGCWQQGAH